MDDKKQSGLLPVADRIEDSNYYEKLSKEYHLAKYIVIAVLLLFVLICCIAGRSGLRSENFKYFFKYFQVDPFSSSPAYEGVTYTGNADMRLAIYKGDLVILCDGNLTMYNLAGKTVMNTATDHADAMDGDGKYLAVYKRGAKTAKLYNSFSDVYTITADDPITQVCTDAEGGFAVVSSEKGMRSNVTVYNRAFSPVYVWKSPDKYVFCADLSDDGKKIGIFCYGTESGKQYSEFIVRGTDGSTLCDEKYYGEQPLKLFFHDGGSYVSVTDVAVRTYSDSGEKTGEVQIGGTLLLAFCDGERTIVCSRPAGTSGTDVTVFDADGNETDSHTVGAEIYSAVSDRENIYLLGYDKVFMRGKNSAEYDVTGGALDMRLLTDGSLLLCYSYGTALLQTNLK